MIYQTDYFFSSHTEYTFLMAFLLCGRAAPLHSHTRTHRCGLLGFLLPGFPTAFPAVVASSPLSSLLLSTRGIIAQALFVPFVVFFFFGEADNLSLEGREEGGMGRRKGNGREREKEWERENERGRRPRKGTDFGIF